MKKPIIALAVFGLIVGATQLANADPAHGSSQSVGADHGIPAL
jgi:hypothetical protein